MRALNNQERHNAVNADTRQQHRDARKHSQQNYRKPSRRDRIGNNVFECTNVRQRQGRIDPPEFAANRWKQTAQVLVAPDYVDRCEIRLLSERNVHFRLWLDIQSEMAHVADNSHDRDPFRIFLRVIKGNAFTHNISVRQKFFRKRLIDDDYSRRVRIVRFRKKPAFDQRRLKSMKIVGRNLPFFFVRSRAVVG